MSTPPPPAHDPEPSDDSEVVLSDHPTLEELFSQDGKHRYRVVPDTCRVRWPAFGSLSDITVLEDAEDQLHSPQYPFIGHAIADMPMTVPPVSSVNVEIDVLRDWQLSSSEEHYEMRDDCSGFDFNSRNLPEPCSCECPDEEEYDWRYYAPPPCLVTASDPATGVTIGDYVLAASPYLQQHESDIRKACIRMLDIEEANQPEAKCFVLPHFDIAISFTWVSKDGVVGEGYPFNAIGGMAKRRKSMVLTG